MSALVGLEYMPGGNSNIFVRQMLFDEVGDVVNGHRHNFDHVTYVARGVLRIQKLNENGEVVDAVTKHAGPNSWVLIKAGVAHRITALEAGSVGHCIYAHRTPQGEVVQEYDGWQAAYL